MIPSAHVSAYPSLFDLLPKLTLSSGEDAGIVDFSKVFDLDYLRKRLNYPVLQWSDVKTIDPKRTLLTDTTLDDAALEKFGCWSTKARDSEEPFWATESENILNLDLSFSRLPPSVYLDEHDPSESFTSFGKLASTIYPTNRSSKAQSLIAKSRFNSELPPDRQLACFDFLYYVSSGIERLEMEQRWSPVWSRIGQHMRWSTELVELSDAYIRRAFGLPEASVEGKPLEALPPVR